MTPEERFDRIEESLLDVSEKLAGMAGLMSEVGQVQRRQAAVMLELAERTTQAEQNIIELGDKVDALITIVDGMIKRQPPPQQ